MSQPSESLITINLDGKDVQVPAGLNLIDAAELHKVEIPHYCYHPRAWIGPRASRCSMKTVRPKSCGYPSR